jgi:hypothetical protein
MQPTSTQWRAAIVLLLSLARRGSAEPITYTFMAIADNIRRPGFSQTIDAPALNDLGTVAFTIDVAGPVGGGIFTGNGGPLTTIVTTVPLFPSGHPSLNDAGTVAFRDAAGQGVFAGSGGPITTIADTSGPFRPAGFGGFPSINKAGTVTFFASPKAGGSGIFAGSGGPIVTIADTTGRFSSFFGAPSTINDAGTVAFLAALRSGGSGVFTGSGGSITTIADTSGPYSGFFGGTASINNAGMVVFLAALSTGQQGIFAGDGTKTTTIADTTGPFSGFGADPSINNLGMIAFDGFLRTGGEGIFTGPDPASDKVIAIGDSLFGSNVTALLFGPEGLNDAGEVAFLAELGDGRIAIARADPTVVPEPIPFSLCLWGAAGLILISRRMNGRYMV